MKNTKAVNGFVVYRHGSNAANQSMTPTMPVAYIKASTLDEARKLAKTHPACRCYNNQHLEVRFASRCKRSDVMQSQGVNEWEQLGY